MFTNWLLTTGPILAYFLYFLIIFVESGILIGFVLPGDSLLFTMGILASSGHFSFLLLLILGVAAAIAGNTVGYIFGRRIGPLLFTPDNKRKYLNHRQLEQAHDFYEKYGANTIILARFTPFVRTFAPILAGVSEMKYTLFITYTVVGGVLWVAIVTALGYYLGQRVANVDHYILPIIVVIIILSMLPALIGIMRERRKQAARTK